MLIVEGKKNPRSILAFLRQNITGRAEDAAKKRPHVNLFFLARTSLFFRDIFCSLCFDLFLVVFNPLLAFISIHDGQPLLFAVRQW